MKLEMSAKDKKLLIGLAIGVIIVCIGYWGIFPILTDIQDIGDEIEEQSALEQINAMKLAQLPILEMENEEYEQEILSTRAEFYKMLTSDEIDKIFTGKAILHSLYAYEMNIAMPKDETKLDPYKFSHKALYGDDEEDDDLGWGLPLGMEMSAPNSAEALFGDEDEDEMIGIYSAIISMKLGGTPEDLQSFLEDLADEGIKLRIRSYSYTDSRNVVSGEGNTFDVVIDRNLDVQLEIYMCEE